MEENPGHIKTQSDLTDLKDNQLVNSGEREVDTSNNGVTDKFQEKKDENVSSECKESDKNPVFHEENSPDNSCPICLGQLENKSFTDSCFHTFCFTCLLQWSKVKAECPLCKQKFKSIVHNVRSIEDYDQYFINTTKCSDSFWSSLVDGRRFRYHSTLTHERILDRQRRRIGNVGDSLENRIASHRSLYAPHSVRSYTASEVARIPCNFRSGIYESDMWVKSNQGSSSRRVREISPEFYRENPACTHRLIPWLNRELVALLHNSESQVTFVLELIMALIMRYDIRSQEFFVHIEPYLTDRTSHFVHEFYNFACSPYDMERYDRHAIYSLQEPSNARNCSSPGSDVIPVSVDQVPSTSRERISSSSQQSKKSKNSYKRLEKLILKKNHETDSWQSVLSLQASSSSSSLNSPSLNNSENFTDMFTLAGPSTSSSTYMSTNELSFFFDSLLGNSSFVSSTQSTIQDDNECRIVDVIPPKSQRKPEIIEILSSDDELAQSSNEKKSNTVSVVTLSSDDNSVGNNYDLASVNPDSFRIRDTFDLSSISSDELEQHTNLFETTSTKKYSKYRKGDMIDNVMHKARKSWTKYLIASKEPRSEQNRDVHCLTSPSTSSSPTSKHLELSSSWAIKNNDSHISAVTHDTAYESSSDTCSEALSKPKKLKLRSVVAQVSTDHQPERSDSGRSRKKHKEKRKKKKKHSHHRRHSRSCDSD